MCQAGPRSRPNREIAWHTERLLLHVRHTNSKRSSKASTNYWKIILGNELFSEDFLDFLKCSQYKVNEETNMSKMLHNFVFQQ